MKLYTIIFLFIFLPFYGQAGTEEFVEVEGFFCKAFELNEFYELIKDDELQTENGVLIFDETLQAIDSLKKYTDYRYPNYKKGFYIKIQGIKKTGDKAKRRYRGWTDYSIEVSKILAADTTKTLFDYITNKLKTDGYYISHNDTLKAPRLIEQDKEYLFEGHHGKYKIILEAKRINKADITYTLTYYKRKKKVKKINGLLTTNLFRNKFSYFESGELTYTYESNDDKYGQSLITFIIYDIPNVIFMLDDNNIIGDRIEMTEIKKKP